MKDLIYSWMLIAPPHVGSITSDCAVRVWNDNKKPAVQKCATYLEADQLIKF